MQISGKGNQVVLSLAVTLVRYLSSTPQQSHYIQLFALAPNAVVISQVPEFWSFMWEPWIAFQAHGFDWSIPGHCKHCDSEVVEGSCLSFSAFLPNK